MHLKNQDQPQRNIAALPWSAGAISQVCLAPDSPVLPTHWGLWLGGGQSWATAGESAFIDKSVEDFPWMLGPELSTAAEV